MYKYESYYKMTLSHDEIESFHKTNKSKDMIRK